MKKRVLALLLAAVLLLACMAGCSKNNSPASNEPGGNTGSGSQSGDNTGSSSGGKNEAFDTEYAYVANSVPMYFPEGMQPEYINHMSIVGTTAYFTAEMIVGKETSSWVDENGENQEYEYDKYETMLFRMDLTNGQASPLESYKLRDFGGSDGYSYINGIQSNDDGTVTIIEQGYTMIYDLPEDFDEETMNMWDYYTGEDRSIRLVTLNADGTIAEDRELSFDMDIYDVMLDDDGYIYGTDYSTVQVFNPDGSHIGMMEFSELVKVGGKICGVNWGEEGREVLPIDPVNLTTGDPVELSQRAYNTMAGFGDYEYLYDYNGTIFGYNGKTAQDERVLSWMDCDVDSSYIQSYSFAEDGTVYALDGTYDESAYKFTYDLLRMDRVLRSTLPEKTEIVFACMYLDWEIRTKIVAFNKSHPDVRIVVHDYSEFNTEDNWDAGMTRLNAEILSGQIPDLLDLSSLPVSRYAAKGYLQDLWELIDADPKLSRDDLMTNVFDALAIDGKLYQICSAFTIQTVLGDRRVVGDGDSWTLKDLMDAKADLPEDATIFGEYDTKDSILSNCISRNLTGFIDWNTGKCSFDSQEFIDMLKFADSFPREFNWEDYDYDATYTYESEIVKMRSGRQMLLNAYLYSFEQFQYQRSIFGENTNFIGMPTTEGTGSNFEVITNIGMSSTCGNKDAAWSFLRELLLPENQVNRHGSYWQFPTNRTAFEDYVKKAMTPQMYVNPETGLEEEQPKTSYWVNENETIDIFAMKQDEYDAFMKIYESTHAITTYDEAVMEIINNEAAAFFDGQKSAEETARLVQSRVSLYVAEQS